MVVVGLTCPEVLLSLLVILREGKEALADSTLCIAISLFSYRWSLKGNNEMKRKYHSSRGS